MPSLIGNKPNQVPTNGDLGKMAFQDSDNVNILGGTAVLSSQTVGTQTVTTQTVTNPQIDTAITDIRPSLLLDFAKSKTLDPMITFTRASTASFYDGKTTAKAEENLILYSEQLDIWSKSETTVTANFAVAPDGNTTADKITPSTNTARHTVQQNFTSIGATYVWSIYAKPNGYNRITIRESQSSGNGATFDVSTGTVISNLVSGVGSITSVGNGWYRCSVVATETAGVRSMSILINSNTGSGYEAAFAGDGTSSVYLWGAQLEQRSTVTAYTATTTAPITNYIPALQTAASGVARFDHNPTTGESLGLLIEESRTNLALQSADFTTTWVSSRVTSQSNVAIAPDGTLTADRIFEDTTATNTHRVYQSITTTATAYTISVYAKASGRNWIYFTQSDSSSVQQSAFFNLSTGTLGTVTSGYTASIQSVGNGWYRCIATISSAFAGAGTPVIGLATADTASTYTGDGWSGVFLWGAQLEAGAFATSYIPTTTASVTRAFDAASMTGTNFSSWFNQDEGVIYTEAKATTNAVTGTVLVQIDNGSTTGNRYLLDANATTSIRAYVDAKGTTASAIVGSLVSNSLNKTSFGYSSSALSLVVNGGAVSTASTNLRTSDSTRLTIGNYGTNNGFLNGTMKKLAYYPKRLANAELQEMTS